MVRLRDDREVAGEERERLVGEADGEREHGGVDRLGDEQVGDPLDVGDDLAALGDHRRAATRSCRRAAPAGRPLRLAPLPEPIATPMSASLSASTSLTPSPVMATVWPWRCRAWTIARFWCGCTRPNTDGARQHVGRARRGPRGSSRASTGSSAPGMPTPRAMAPTVIGLSPEITFTATPCSREVGDGGGGVGADLLLEAHQRGRLGASSPAASSSAGRVARGASRMTRRPVPASCATRCRSRVGRPASSTSGAPRSQVPRPSKVAPDHLRADENGTDGRRRPALVGAHLAPWRAGWRWGAGRPAPARPARPSTASSAAEPSGRSMPVTRSAPAVSVPVLSTHTTSTRASTSTAGSSCTRALRRASVVAPTAKARLVSRTRPSGTMAPMPATDARSALADRRARCGAARRPGPPSPAPSPRPRP